MNSLILALLSLGCLGVVAGILERKAVRASQVGSGSHSLLTSRQAMLLTGSMTGSMTGSVTGQGMSLAGQDTSMTEVQARRYNNDNQQCHGEARCSNLKQGRLVHPLASLPGIGTLTGGVFENIGAATKLYERLMSEHGEDEKCNYGYTDIEIAEDFGKTANCKTPCHGVEQYVCACMPQDRAREGNAEDQAGMFGVGATMLVLGLIGLSVATFFVHKRKAHYFSTGPRGLVQQVLPLLCFFGIPAAFAITGIIVLARAGVDDMNDFHVGCGPSGSAEHLPRVNGGSLS